MENSTAVEEENLSTQQSMKDENDGDDLINGIKLSSPKLAGDRPQFFERNQSTSERSTLEMKFRIFRIRIRICFRIFF